MKTIKFGLLAAMLSATIPICAQFSFQPTLHGAGSRICQQVAAQVNKQIAGLQITGIPTRSQCEQIRSQILAFKASGSGCNVYYTATPCVGTELNSSSANPTQVTQPTLNPGVEIRNQIQDYDYQRKVQEAISEVERIVTGGPEAFNDCLNQLVNEDIAREKSDFISPGLRKMIPNVENAATWAADVFTGLVGEVPFTGADMRKELSTYLEDEFRDLTGVDIDNLLNSGPLDMHQQEILNHYNEFCDLVLKRIIDSPKKEENSFDAVEMAAYALGVYKDDGLELAEQYVNCTPLRDLALIKNPDEIDAVSKIIDFIKDNEGKHSFNSEIYYDRDRDRYILAFRGTKGRKDLDSDVQLAVTGAADQHNIVSKMADVILASGIPLDKLVITGHSMGGGQATHMGLRTGCLTYAYNPQHLSDAVVRNYKLDTSNQSNIYTYTAKNERFVAWSEGAASGVKIVSDAVQNVIEKGLKLIPSLPGKPGNEKVTELFKGTEKMNRFGKQIPVEYVESDASGHRQTVMLKSIAATDVKRANRYNNARHAAEMARKWRSNGSLHKGSPNKTKKEPGLILTVIPKP